ncbi:hypothetical protein HAX54_048063, partial [Datura stramonium]|nr:hypothetical protein [Datura stramonium]
MKLHNPVLLDFIAYKVEVTHNNKWVELKGIYSEGELRSMSAKWMRQLLKKGHAIWAHFFTLPALEKRHEDKLPAEIDQ